VHFDRYRKEIIIDIDARYITGTRDSRSMFKGFPRANLPCRILPSFSKPIALSQKTTSETPIDFSHRAGFYSRIKFGLEILTLEFYINLIKIKFIK